MNHILNTQFFHLLYYFVGEGRVQKIGDRYRGMGRKRWDRRVRDVMRIVKVVKKVAIRRGLDKRIRRGERGRLSKHPAYVYIRLWC